MKGGIWRCGQPCRECMRTDFRVDPSAPQRLLGSTFSGADGPCVFCPVTAAVVHAAWSDFLGWMSRGRRLQISVVGPPGGFDGDRIGPG